MAIYLPITIPPTEPASVSTDTKYLGHSFASYDKQWLGEWSVEKIRRHRDTFQEGRVFQGKRLARFFKRDSNVVGALGQRVAPWLGCPHTLEGGSDGARAELELMLAVRGTLLQAPTKRSVAEDLTMCGLAVLQTTWRPRKDGTRWDPIVEVWDLESVDHDPRCGYVAMTREGRVPIVHGDGKWSVIRTTEKHPHENGAVIPLSLPVASRGHSIVDRASGGRAIGHPKLHAELPDKIAVGSDVGKSLDAAVGKLWDGVRHIVTAAGTKLAKVEFTGTGWQIFRDGPKLDKSDIFLALTGQDGSAANEGGSYAKAYILQGILFAWVVEDVAAGSSGYTSGILRPWAAINTGDPENAPAIMWPLPDPEVNEMLSALAKRHLDFAASLAAHRTNGHKITREWVEATAKEFRVVVPPYEPMKQAES